MTDGLDKPIGTKEQPKLTAGSVTVKKVEIEKVKTRKGGEASIVSFSCIHPDREELVRISNMKLKKVQGNNETITKDGIWYREDQEGNIDKRCNASEVMRCYKKDSLRMFENSSITTELDAAGYLCIKAY